MQTFVETLDGIGSAKFKASPGRGSSSPKSNRSGDEEEKGLLSLLSRSSRVMDKQISTSSSSSGASDEEDYFQLDASKFGIPSVVDEAKLFSPHASPPRPERLNLHEPNQSPPVQMMSQSDLPMGLKIPSSVLERAKSPNSKKYFTTTSTTTTTSIITTNSVDVTPPSRFEYLSSPKREIDRVKQVPQPLTIADQATQMADEEAMKVVLRDTPDGHSHLKGPPLSASNSHRSDCSNTSIASFAFPILAAELTASHKVYNAPSYPSQLQRNASAREKEQTNNNYPVRPTPSPNQKQKSWCFCSPCFFCY